MELWAKDALIATPVVAPPKRRSARLLRIEMSVAMIICDLVMLTAACLAIHWIYIDTARSEYLPAIYVALVALYLVFSIYGKALGAEVFLFVSKSMNRAFVSIATSLAIIFATVQFVFPSLPQSLALWAGLACSTTFAILTGRLIFEHLISRNYKSAIFDRVIIIDDVRVSVPDGYRSINVRRQGIEPNSGDPMMRHWASLYLADADRVIIACKPARYQRWAAFIKGSNIRIELLMPELNALGIANVSRHGSDTTIGISNGDLDGWNRILKRAFDLSVAAILALFSAPIVIVSAIFIKLDDGGPVFFSQPRMGRGNRLFNLYKLRSMTAKPGAGNSRQITRIGRYLRASSIDELPQLLNVLLGHMSLVGPRPHALESVVGDQFFWEVDEQYWHRHAIKPGITGLAQVRGFRGATNHQSDLTDRLRSDLEYLRGWTIWRDMLILAFTLGVMVHKNAR